MTIFNKSKEKLFKKFILVVMFSFVLLPVINCINVLPLMADETEVGSETTAQETPPVSETGESGGGGGEAVIVSGDIGVETGVDNTVNQNVFTEESSADSESTQNDPETTEVSETLIDPPEDNTECSSGCSENGSDGELEIEISNNNEAEVDNTSEGDLNTGENEISDNEGDSVIVSGEIGVGATTENDVNKNITQVPCESGCEGDTFTDLDVDNDNTANATNTTDIEANTGENTITDTSGDAAIVTGKIEIYNAVINYINQNFTGFGQEFLVDLFTKHFNSLDLSGFEEERSGNEENDCEPDCSIDVSNTNNSDIENDITIEANTGINKIATSGEISVIETGDITAINDIVNVTNLNVSGNDWFFAVVNVFDLMVGDIILPVDEEDLVEGDSETMVESSGAQEFIIANDNYADVLNNIEINANTGENQITGEGEAAFLTGDVSTKVSAFNFVNYNFTGDGWKFVRVNVFGTWDGDIHGLPLGYNYWEDEHGITIYNDSFYDDIFDDVLSQLNVENFNDADVLNNIIIDATSGENEINGNLSDAFISTGDINIQNSLLNFINSTFTGNDWEFSMINVFGEWQGNLAFGQPELWVTEAVSTPGPVVPGDFITYTFLFGNNGDGLATNVRILDDFNEKFVKITDKNDGQKSNGSIGWDIGNLPANSQGSLSYTVQVKDNIPAGKNKVANAVSIGGYENDRDYSNNASSGTVVADGGDGTSHAAVYAAPTGILSIVKTNNAEGILYPGDTVDYKIVVKNPSELDLLDVIVFDTLVDENGNEIKEGTWDLDTLHDGEEVLIEYTLKINDNINSGVYTNEAYVDGYDTSQKKYISAIASSKIKVENPNYYNADNEYKPQIAINKTFDSEYVNPGVIFENKIIIANNGNYDALDVVVTEKLPEGFTYTEGGVSAYEWNFEKIKSGEIKTITYTVRGSSDLEPGIYKHEVTVEGSNIEKFSASFNIRVRRVEVLGVSTGEEAEEITTSITKPTKSKIGNLVSKILSDNEAMEDDIQEEPERAAVILGSEDGSDPPANLTPYEDRFSSKNLIIGLSVIFMFLLVVFFVVMALYKLLHIRKRIQRPKKV